jgi:hypothetical protein
VPSTKWPVFIRDDNVHIADACPHGHRTPFAGAGAPRGGRRSRGPFASGAGADRRIHSPQHTARFRRPGIRQSGAARSRGLRKSAVSGGERLSRQADGRADSSGRSRSRPPRRTGLRVGCARVRRADAAWSSPRNARIAVAIRAGRRAAVVHCRDRRAESSSRRCTAGREGAACRAGFHSVDSG